MKVAAIISEYNPLHNGHKYQIEQTKKITGCDAVISIMSGNFTQRAEPAILDKYTRAEVTIKQGVDMVVSIPTAYSVNNAEVFANAAVKIANSINCVEFLSFGMEQPNLNALKEISEFLSKEPYIYKKELKHNLKKGLSFNKSRVSAIKTLVLNSKTTFRYEKEIFKILDKPNNILAIEYLKALKKHKSKIKPVAVKRVGSEYYEKEIKENFSSASAIRDNIEKSGPNSIINNVPIESYKAIKDAYDNNQTPNFEILNQLIMAKIYTTKKESLKDIYNVSEGIENFIKNKSIKSHNLKDLKSSLKTKRYKVSRINSILINLLLNIDKKTVKKIYRLKHFNYIKVLAIRQNSKILSNLKSKSRLILRKTDIDNINLNKFDEKLIEIEFNSNSIYKIITNSKTEKLNEPYINIRSIKV